MVAIQSKEVIDKISDDLKVQPSLLIPRELAKFIQLVYNVNPGVNDRNIQIASGTASDAASATIFTSHAVKRTFLTGINLTISKDIVSDATFVDILVEPIQGAQVATSFIRFEPLTAGEHRQEMVFEIPIEIKRGTDIILINGTATASIDSTATIFFYETDPQ